MKIAKFLRLSTKESYTGHAFRRSTASGMAESDATTSFMRTHFNRKSEATAMKYIESSDTHKLKVADLIQGNNKCIHFNIQNCNNFVFNLGPEFDAHNC